MSLFSASLLFVALIFLYIVISEMFTVMFRLTGLTEEKARFQVMSLLTGCGFTTAESELLLSSQSRRKLTRNVMLFGYVFNVTIVSAIINMFISFKLSQWEHLFWSLPWPLLALIGLFLLYRDRRVKNWFGIKTEAFANKLMRQKNVNHVLVMDTYDDMVMAHVYVHTLPARLAGKPLQEADLREKFDLLVMLVKRQGQKIENAGGDTVLTDGDMLVVFGDLDNIRSAFDISDAAGMGQER